MCLLSLTCWMVSGAGAGRDRSQEHGLEGGEDVAPAVRLLPLRRPTRLRSPRRRSQPMADPRLTHGCAAPVSAPASDRPGFRAPLGRASALASRANDRTPP